MNVVQIREKAILLIDSIQMPERSKTLLASHVNSLFSIAVGATEACEALKANNEYLKDQLAAISPEPDDEPDDCCKEVNASWSSIKRGI